jgi:SPP1 family predicted phage head-tail adaptor
MIQAGSLDTLITIEQSTEIQNAVGEPIAVWTEFCKAYAAKSYRTGKEFFQAGRTVAEGTVHFTIRHIDGITTKMRVSHDGVLYNILFVKLSNKRRESIELECTQVA